MWMEDSQDEFLVVHCFTVYVAVVCTVGRCPCISRSMGCKYLSLPTYPRVFLCVFILPYIRDVLL